MSRNLSSTSDLSRTLREWQVSPLRGSTEFYADAAFSTLRAHAAGKSNSHKGLCLVIRCDLYEGLVWEKSVFQTIDHCLDRFSRSLPWSGFGLQVATP